MTQRNLYAEARCEDGSDLNAFEDLVGIPAVFCVLIGLIAMIADDRATAGVQRTSERESV